MRSTSAAPGRAAVRGARRCGRGCGAPRGGRAAAPGPRASAAATEPAYHNVIKAEIPVHIPRQDLLKQLFRWAEADAGDSLETYGVVTGVEVIDVSDVLSVGFTITVHEQLPSGALSPRASFEVRMDEEEVDGYDSVNRDEQGFPKMETNDGERKVVKGRCLLVRRRADAPVPGDLVEPVTKMLKNFMLAVNKYYAFGSCWSEEF